MAIAYVQTLTPWEGITTGVSAPFTPADGDCVIVTGADMVNYPQTLLISGTLGASITIPYAVLTPPGTFASDYGDTWQMAYQLEADAIAQTISVLTNGTGDYTLGFALEYSGVASVAGTENPSAQPGTGTGAVVGASVLVPTGSVLLAIAVDEDPSSPALTATAGTTRLSGQTAVHLFGYCITEYAGAGANIQPAFTSSNGATGYYEVTQFLLTPPSAILLGQALT